MFAEGTVPAMEVMKLFVGSILEMKKPHPCGAKTMKLMRVGSRCRVVCTGCGRDMDLDRIKLEKAIKSVTPPAEDATQNKT